MSDKYEYGYGLMARDMDLYVVGNDAATEDTEHGIVFERATGKWTAWSVDFGVAAIAYADRESSMFVVGEAGQVEVTTPLEAWDEQVDPGPDGPSSIRNLNAAAVVGRHVYVAGMRRQVYRRRLDRKEVWERFDAGCFLEVMQMTALGFNALHGADEDELFAAGLQGEIWCCTKGRWSPVDSPCNMALDHVHQTASGVVLVGGALGVLLRGSKTGFAVIDHGETRAAITSIAEFQGEVFVADQDGGLFSLKSNALQRLPALTVDEPRGGQLHSNGHALLYVTSGSVHTFDGRSWQRCDPPDDA